MPDSQQKSVTVETAWGETNKDAMYSKETGLCYFKCAGDGILWLNYEPGMVQAFRLNQGNI